MRQDIRDGWLGTYFPSKPTALQFLANDVCNSRCTMCNIWQHEPEPEIVLAELRSILADPLFRGIKHVEITGGEPTLRSDLPEIGQVFVKSLSKTKSIQITTNVINSQMVLERTMALAQVTQVAGIQLRVSVSLDGIGDDHDRNRGVEGNFVSAVKVIKALTQKGIPVSVNCTITPLNCYGVDDVLLRCEQNGIQEYNFRLGIEVNRFNNQGYSRQNPFTPEQRFHLIMFFSKLARQPGSGRARRLFYEDLANQLAFDHPRRSSCVWQTSGVTLDMHGNLSYCSVKSPLLDSAIKKSAWVIYKDGSPQRAQIVRQECASCQYDEIGAPSLGQLARFGAKITEGLYQQQRSRFTSRTVLVRRISPARQSAPSAWKHVLITGWYGTETTGDKAIIGEVVHFVKKHSPDCKITVTTIDHRISQQTRYELADLRASGLVDIQKADKPALIESVDAVIIGGGPLMETAQMEYVWRIFREANRQQKARIIFGCGVGPFHTRRMESITGNILAMATVGFLRDEESHSYAQRLAPGNALAVACDPAFAFVARWAEEHPLDAQQPGALLKLATLLRANTKEFTNKQQVESENARAAKQLAQFLQSVSRSHSIQIDLLYMNAPWIGGDDRLFNRQIASYMTGAQQIRVERAYLPTEALLSALRVADVAIAMRYHGHIFCMALGIPFLSINYTGSKGKVDSLVKRIGYQDWSLDWRNIDPEEAAEKMRCLIENRQYWSANLKEQTARLRAELNQTYQQVFNV